MPARPLADETLHLIAAVRDALAEMEGLAPASVRVVSSGTVVADLNAVVGENFDKPGVYEWFVESPNAW